MKLGKAASVKKTRTEQEIKKEQRTFKINEYVNKQQIENNQSGE